MTDCIWHHLQGVEFKQTFYDAGGIRTRAIEAGQGPVVVLLHGTGGHAEAYAKNIAAHAQHFHVYAIDMVGHGYTEAPADAEYDMQGYVDHLLGFLNAIQADKACISGESLGASVACWFALQHPDRVEKLVFNTGIPLAPDTPEGIQQMRDLLDRAKKASGAPTLETIRMRMNWLFADADKSLTDELVESRFRIYSQPGRAPVLGRITQEAIGQLIDPESQKTWYRPNQLAELDCPVLLVWSHHNPGQPLPLAQKAADMIPDAKLVVLEQSAHWPQWEEPDAFNAAHLGFLLGSAQ